MTKKQPKPALSVIMPALNEEENIGLAIKNSLAAFDRFSIPGEIVAINDGSTDHTQKIMESWRKKDRRVRIVRHASPMGVGASFWDGVDHARGWSVVMLPGDNENDPAEIFRYHDLLNSVDIVIPFVFNKQVRSLFRNGLSFVYRFIINTTFLVYFNYTNGTVIYRKAALDGLEFRSSGFFFQTDILIRLVKRGYLFAEVPYRLDLRKDGVSKAVTFPSFLQVCRGYLKLVKDIHFDSRTKGYTYSGDSVTHQRRNTVEN
ncbi:MAG: glycosyltransferase family 2 protein [Deltaproteobacteria bacterium]|nr:glycosyltransferase family 2 protein [Deltaproteobacteria bacterium]